MKENERKGRKGRKEKKNDDGEQLIYKFLLEVKREKKQNDAESGIHINGLRCNTYNNKE